MSVKSKFPLLSIIAIATSGASNAQLGSLISKQIQALPNSPVSNEEKAFFTEEQFPQNAINVRIESISASERQPNDGTANMDIKYSVFWDSIWVERFVEFSKSKSIYSSTNQAPIDRIKDDACSKAIKQAFPEEERGGNGIENIALLCIGKNRESWSEFKGKREEYDNERLFCKDDPLHCKGKNIADKSFLLKFDDLVFSSRFKNSYGKMCHQFDALNNNDNGQFYIITKSTDGVREILRNGSSPYIIEGKFPLIHHFYTQVPSIRNLNAINVSFNDTIQNSATISIPKKSLPNLKSIEIKIFSQLDPTINTESLLFKKLPQDSIKNIQPNQNGNKFANLTSYSTKFGELIIGEESEVIYKSKKDTPNEIQKKYDTLFKASNVTVTVDTIISMKDREIVLMADLGGPGTGCPARYTFVTITSQGATATEDFGTCNEKNSITQNGNIINVYMNGYKGKFESKSEQKMASKEKHIFTLQNGIISEKMK